MVQAGRTQPCTSPTPEGKLPLEFAPPPHPRDPPPPHLSSAPPSSWRSIISSTTAASAMARGSSKTVVKRTKDEALEYVKTALRTNCSLFTKQEITFIRTSCQILGLDGNAMIKSVQSKVKDNGMKQPWKVMEYLQARLRELADRVEKHKRPTPNPAGCTRAANPMGASARSLGNLVGCAEALKEAMAARYSKGIKAGMKQWRMRSWTTRTP